MSESESYSISEIVLLTGLSADLLRNWERRYRAITPSRTEGNDRLYSAADLDRLRLLRRAIDSSHAIKRIARYTTEQLRQLLLLDVGSDPYKPLIDNFLNDLSKLRVGAMRRDQRELLEMYSRDDVVFKLVIPGLQRYLVLEAEGKMNPIHYQVLNNMTSGLLGMFAMFYPPRDKSRVALVGSLGPPNTKLWAKCAALVLLNAGYQATYIGSQLREVDLRQACDDTCADAIVFYVEPPVHADDLVTFDSLHDKPACDAVYLVAASGHAEEVGQFARRIGAAVFEDLENFNVYIKGVKKKTTTRSTGQVR